MVRAPPSGGYPGGGGRGGGRGGDRGGRGFGGGRGGGGRGGGRDGGEQSNFQGRPGDWRYVIFTSFIFRISKVGRYKSVYLREYQT